MNTKHSHPVDIHISQRLKTVRIARNLSQEGLADMVDVSLRQLQRYESGTSRVPASALYDLAEILAVPVLDFYRGLGGPVIRDLNRRDYILIEHLGAIRDRDTRKALRRLARRLAEG